MPPSFNVPCTVWDKSNRDCKMLRSPTGETSRNTKLRGAPLVPLPPISTLSCKLLQVISYVLLQCHNNIKRGKRNERRSRFAVLPRTCNFQRQRQERGNNGNGSRPLCAANIHDKYRRHFDYRANTSANKGSSAVHMHNYAHTTPEKLRVFCAAKASWTLIPLPRKTYFLITAHYAYAMRINKLCFVVVTIVV